MITYRSSYVKGTCTNKIPLAVVVVVVCDDEVNQRVNKTASTIPTSNEPIMQHRMHTHIGEPVFRKFSCLN
jgi:hypothetical protein